MVVVLLGFTGNLATPPLSFGDFFGGQGARRFFLANKIRHLRVRHDNEVNYLFYAWPRSTGEGAVVRIVPWSFARLGKGKSFRFSQCCRLLPGYKHLPPFPARHFQIRAVIHAFSFVLTCLTQVYLQSCVFGQRHLTVLGSLAPFGTVCSSWIWLCRSSGFKLSSCFVCCVAKCFGAKTKHS